MFKEQSLVRVAVKLRSISVVSQPGTTWFFSPSGGVPQRPTISSTQNP